MMAAPVRVAIITAATIHITTAEKQLPPQSFPPPHTVGTVPPTSRGRPRGLEWHIDNHVYQAARQYREIEVDLELKTDHGVIRGQFTAHRGFFESCRRSLAESFVALAHKTDSKRETAASLAQAQLLDGRPRSWHDLPPPTEPSASRPSVFRRLQAASLHLSTTMYCQACGRRIPRLLGYQESRAVSVPQLHRQRTDSGTSDAPICPGVVADWASLDPRPLEPYGSPIGPLPPLLPPREWLRLHLRAVPTENGGPLIDQIHVLAAALEARGPG